MLKDCNAEVFIGAEGSAAILQNREFPNIQILPLRGYRIQYAKFKVFFFINILLQLPKIARAVNYEKKWLDKIIDTEKIDVVISDNRLGLSSKKIPCYFITHQLHIKSSFSLLDKIIQNINYSYINQFKECWVPDLENENNYAGELSHPKILPKVPVKYIGLLSRFQKADVQKKYNLAIVISGPEPQRTIFENKILGQLKLIDVSVLLVRGLPDEKQPLKSLLQNITYYNHLDAEALSVAMQQSEIILSRSGYSTIMDLIAIGQKAFLVPTPGQTEQEYLAKYLSEKGLFKSIAQDELDLKKVLNSI
jgi:uncharacterized protein (TIGR00661 family)